MQAAARQAACVALRGGLLQQAVLPALTFQVTSLASLTGLSVSLAQQQSRSRQPYASSSSGSLWGSGALALSSQHAQQRHIFNFAGFGGDLSKSHHEKKLLG